ncbi:uncharacterized protein YALI1_E12013g [Yarrowia lipolytica]|uniref:Uncharacterized protein n=1 Tax=Yarrowia lipolytica TaxID=4952 RepID=A0A1D8NHS9_YARLL|nr:hypothetical protein YALI1_E12013g [Yarrowia lipolytica]
MAELGKSLSAPRLTDRFFNKAGSPSDERTVTSSPESKPTLLSVRLNSSPTSFRRISKTQLETVDWASSYDESLGY